MEANKLNLITRFTTFFVKNSRGVLLLLVAILGLGFLAYSSLLQREGFPAAQFPISTLNVSYFVEDAEEIDEKITKPIEKAASNIEEVDTIESTTTENFVNFVFIFEESVTSEEGNKLIQDEVQETVALPDAANVNYTAINATSIDGENDFVFTLTYDKQTPDIERLIKDAKAIQEELSGLTQVTAVDVKNPFSTQVNPVTGEEFQEEEGFNRVGYLDDNDELVFKKSISIGLQKTDQTDVIEFSDLVRTTVNELKEKGEINEDSKFIYGGDLAVTLNDQLDSLERNTLTALVVVVIIVLLLINWRAALTSVLFVPTVIAAVFAALYFAGSTLNVISLFALILVLGLFVDDIIVVVEAIDYEKKQGKKGLQAVQAAIQRVGVADLLGTVTTLAVFAPMLAISGILGDFITQIPFTVIIALSLSLVLALSIFAWLASVLLPENRENQRKTILYYVLNGFSILTEKLGNQTSKFVNSYLKRKWATALVLIVSVLLIGAGGATASQLSFDIFPAPKDSEEINIDISYDSNTNIEDAKIIAQEVEEIVKQDSKHVEEVSYFNANENNATLRVMLTDLNSRDATSVEIVDKLNSSFSEVQNAEVEANAISNGPPASEYPFQMQVFAKESQTLEQVTTDIKGLIEDYQYTTVEDEVIHTEEVVRSNIDTIAKRDGERFASIQAAFDTQNVANELLTDLEAEIKKEFDAQKLDSEYSLDEEALGFDQGIESDNAESFESALVAFYIALIIMYSLLVIQFNSFTQPLLIFAAIPFSFLGLFPGLWLTGNALSFFVMIGIIALAGIVVNNTIILIDYANQLREEGKNIRDAIAEAIRIRFRPLVTTSVTTVAGLLPLALTDPFWESLAFSIVFGLVSSTTLVILAFPAYYAVVEKLRKLRNMWLDRIFKH